MKDTLLVALDFETTGLDTSTDVVVEVGLVASHMGTTVLEMSFLVDNGNVPMSKEAAKVHGITGTMMEKSLHQEKGILLLIQTLTVLSTCYKQMILISHNGMHFDFKILKNWLKRTPMPFYKFYLLDTFLVMKTENKLGISSYSLKSVYEKMFGDRLPGHHGALSDCQALMRAFAHYTTYVNPNMNWEKHLHALTQKTDGHFSIEKL